VRVGVRVGVGGRVGLIGDYFDLFDIAFVSTLLVHEVWCGHHSTDHVLEPARCTIEQKRRRKSVQYQIAVDKHHINRRNRGSSRVSIMNWEVRNVRK
jgi:hypothetical protein